MNAVPSAAHLDSTTEEQLRHACAELERRLRAGEECHAEQYLAALPQLGATVDQAADLIYAEFLTRLELGQLHLAEQFYHRFPSWKDYLQQQFAVHDWLRQSVPPAPVLARESSATWKPLAAPSPSNGASTTKPPGMNWPEQYELLGEIARGGMGVVYKARQVGLNRLVALKMLKGERTLAGDDLTRFRAEAEIIARLQHPHIVQIFEIGERDGCPFLALEYVPGGSLAQRLTKGPLPPADAAHLVERVAQAVQVAHQNGILHRDLKPGNILLAPKSQKPKDKFQTNSKDQNPNEETQQEIVSGSSSDLRFVCDLSFAICDLEPKLTDFGLAKQLDAVDQHTRTGAVVGTPTYTAPEQVTGRRDILGPHTDVYALGVILYECLTGRPPFQAALLLDLFEAIRRQEPVPPTRLQAKIPADLETICLKCLQKEPAKRYASARELADDLARFRQGEPIRARPVSRRERVWRWCKRNPVVASLLTLLVVVMLAGTVVSTTFWWQAEQNLEAKDKEYQRAEKNFRDKEQEQQRAEKNFRQAEQERKRAVKHHQDMLITVNDFYLRIINSAELERPALTPLRERLLKRAATFMEQIVEEQGDQPHLRFQIAQAEQIRADLYDKLGRHAEAEPVFRKAIDMARDLVAATPEAANMHYTVANFETQYAEMLLRLNRTREAMAHFQAGIDAYADARRLGLDTVAVRVIQGKMLITLATQHQLLREYPAAERNYGHASLLLEPIHRAEPANEDAAVELARCHSNLGQLWISKGKPEDGQKWLERARQVLEHTRQQLPDSTRLATHLARQYNTIGGNLRRLRKPDESVTAYRQAETLSRNLWQENPTLPEHRIGLSHTCQQLGEALLSLDKPTEGWPKLEEAVRVVQEPVPGRAMTPAEQNRLAQACTAHAFALRNAKRTQEAVAPARLAVETRQKLAAREPGNVQALHDLGISWHNLGQVLTVLRQWDEACDACQQAIRCQKQVQAKTPNYPQLKQTLAAHLLLWCDAERGRQNVNAALAAVQEFQKLWPTDAAKQVDAAKQYARCYATIGKGQPTTGPDDEALRERCAKEVAAALRAAVQLGFRDAEAIGKDKLYDPLRQRADFQQVLAELAKKTVKKP